MQVIDEEKMQAMIQVLFEMAMERNLAALKLLLAYTLGKPDKAMENPDRMDLQEWDQMKEESQKVLDAARLIGTPEMAMFLDMARVTRPSISQEMTGKFAQKLQADLDLEKELLEEAKKDKGKKKSANKAKGKEKKARQEDSDNISIDNIDIESILSGSNPITTEAEAVELVNRLAASGFSRRESLAHR